MKTQKVVAPELENQSINPERLAIKSYLESELKENVEIINYTYNESSLMALFGLLESDKLMYYNRSFQNQSLSMEIRGDFSDYKIASRKKLRKKKLKFIP